VWCNRQEGESRSDVHEAKKAVVIATGSRQGHSADRSGNQQDDVISSDEALLLERVPDTLAIIGAGAVGMEFATFSSIRRESHAHRSAAAYPPIEDAEASDVSRRATASAASTSSPAPRSQKPPSQGQGALEIEAGREEQVTAGAS